MRTYHIHIKAETEAEVKEELKELAAIMAGLRKTTKHWQQHFGAENRIKMRRYEEKADAWLDKHKVVA